MLNRSALLYQQRKGMRPTQAHPGDRIAPQRLLIHRYPAGNTLRTAQFAEGSDPPNRPKLVPWPPAEQVTG